MRLRHLLPSLLLVLLAVLPAFAQDATEENSDAEAYVVQAIADLAALPGYHFAYETQTETILTAEDETVTTVTITSAEGDALANGDNYVTISLTSGESLDLAEATPPLHVERTVFNGTSALNFDLEDSVYAEMLPFEEGWQSYDDHTAAAESASIGTQFFLENINNTPIPTQFLTFESLIETVTEAAPETIDGVSLRVFDLELDALGLITQNTPAEQRAGLDDILQNIELLAVSELSATARLWIGADDEQIYQGTISTTNTIPYLSSGNEDQIPYDYATTYTADFTISAHGAAIEIEPVILPE